MDKLTNKHKKLGLKWCKKIKKKLKEGKENELQRM